jgi:hypothetical protein
VVLLGGGTKKRQQQDIATAQECWAAYNILTALQKTEGVQFELSLRR